MVATAFALNLWRDKSVSAINDFISTITYDDVKRKKLMPRHSQNLEKMREEVAREVFECNDGIVDVQININDIVSAILKQNTKSLKITLFIEQCKRIEFIIIVAFLLGIIGSAAMILLRNTVDAYFFCFLVWILSCISLWVTLRLIINDWKDNRYGKGTKN